MDSAASSLTPNSVADKIALYYKQYGINIHRGSYHPAQESAEFVENTRKEILAFLDAPENYGTVFTRNTTESINLLAASLSHAGKELSAQYSSWKTGLGRDDVIILSESEHHSNIIPWQRLAKEKSCHIFYIPVNADGTLNMEEFFRMASNLKPGNIKIISLASVSNVTGIHHNLERILEFAVKNGTLVHIDGAQEVPHGVVSLKKKISSSGGTLPLFYSFSGHKAYGPTGIGFLTGPMDVFNLMEPYQSGGGMIEKVEKEYTTYSPYPFRFEAGTIHIGGIFGMAAAMEFIQKKNPSEIEKIENDLTLYGVEKIESLQYPHYGPSLKDLQTGKVKARSVISFNIPGAHHHDVATFLNEYKVALRSGHHCAQILMDAFSIPGCIRISLAYFNTKEELDIVFGYTEKIRKYFKN